MTTSDVAPHQRAMNDIEKAARALHDADYANEPWRKFDTLHDDDRAHYRAMALAAIDSLGLTEELHTYEETETKSVMGGEGAMRYGGQTTRVLGWRTDRRLVSPWANVARAT